MVQVFWSGTGSLVAIISYDSFAWIEMSAYTEKLEGTEITDEGIEDAFDVLADVRSRSSSFTISNIIYVV